LASSRRHGTSTFGVDLTNVGNIGGKTDKLKPIKPVVPASQQTELPLATSPPAVEPAATESQLAIKTETTNIQEAEEYVTDIVKKLFNDEVSFLPHADYMDQQTDLTPKMRMILMDWLIEVHMKYKLSPETLHLTVNLIDRHLTKKTVVRKRLQLVGVVAMFIASKFEEINPPELHDWVYITDKAYTKQDVLDMECTMLTALNFQIVVPTAAAFLPQLQKWNECDGVHAKLSQYILELGLLDIRMLKYKPSETVAAALLLSNDIIGHRPVWPQSMVQHSHHTEANLQSCVEVLRQLFDADRAGSGGQLQAVHKKFSLKEHHCVATMRF